MIADVRCQVCWSMSISCAEGLSIGENLDPHGVCRPEHGDEEAVQQTS